MHGDRSWSKDRQLSQSLDGSLAELHQRVGNLLGRLVYMRVDADVEPLRVLSQRSPVLIVRDRVRCMRCHCDAYQRVILVSCQQLLALAQRLEPFGIRDQLVLLPCIIIIISRDERLCTVPTTSVLPTHLFGNSSTGMPIVARIPISAATSAAASGKKYMSLKHVTPQRIISCSPIPTNPINQMLGGGFTRDSWTSCGVLVDRTSPSRTYSDREPSAISNELV